MKKGGEMGIRITTLSENAVAGKGDFLAEWGLSIMIETEDAKVLLDTGRSTSIIHNADVLGMNLGDIDKIVLSHSHHDHTGGLRETLRRMKRRDVEIIAHPYVWEARYNRGKDGSYKFMGIPFSRQELENFGATFSLTTEPVRIGNGITTSGEIPMVTEFEEVNPGGVERLIKQGENLEPDELLDDQAVFVKGTEGLIVITGCAHRGIINTLYHAQQVTGCHTIQGVIGGSHLVDASDERIRLTIAALSQLNIRKLGFCHCTGPHAVTMLANEFRDSFFFNNAGTQVEFS